LKKLVGKRIRAESAKGTLLNHPGLGSILFAWQNWDHAAAAGWVREGLKDPKVAIVILQSLAGTSTSTGQGDYFSRTFPLIDRAALESFVPWEEWESAVEGLNVDELTEAQRNVLHAFRAGGRMKNREAFDDDDAIEF
jgi:hypothetical protein